jgi:sporulation protein YlmC with PRC-barrel domain
MALIRRSFLALVALTLSGAAWSAGYSSGGATKDPHKDKATWLDMRASELLGKEVASSKGKELGKIEDLIVDPKGGTIPHVVLSFGGVARLGDKLFVFPVNAFVRDENRDRIVVDVERYQLSESRGFDRSNWPFDPPLRRASELRGAHVKDNAGHPVGEIEDLILNLGTGKVKEVVLAQNGRKGPEPKEMLPLNAFAIPAEPGGGVVLKNR